MHHPLGHFVDGAIAAGRQNQVRAVLDMPARQAARHAGAGGGGGRDAMAVFGEDLEGALDQRSPMPPDLARLRIIDQYGLPVTCYGILPFPR